MNAGGHYEDSCGISLYHDVCWERLPQRRDLSCLAGPAARLCQGRGRSALRAAGLSCDEMRKTLSVAMIAMNEEANLPRTLESVKWADEIVVVDSGSKDRTIEIAQSFGAKTSYHSFGGHGEQKNVALDLCTSDWILLLDADEVLTPALQEEIR